MNVLSIRKWMLAELRNNLPEYVDSANVACATKLAEAADEHFYPNNPGDVEERLFELSAEVVEQVTNEEGLNR